MGSNKASLHQQLLVIEYFTILVELFPLPIAKAEYSNKVDVKQCIKTMQLIAL